MGHLAQTTSPSGLCQCGCGQQTKVAPQSDMRKGWVKGMPMRFMAHHEQRLRRSSRPHYPNTTVANRQVTVHQLRAERALGKRLPKGAECHHLDGSMNADAPLVICQDHAYHMLLHRRARIIKAGGNPNTDELCGRCKQAKPHADFAIDRTQGSGLQSLCRMCSTEASRQRRLAVSL